LLAVVLDEHPQAATGHSERQDAHAYEEEEERPVISLAYAIPHPGTVVIEFAHAAIARVAVLAPGWSVDVAGGTVPVSQWAAEGDGTAGGDGVGGRGWSMGRRDGGDDPRIGRRAIPKGEESRQRSECARPYREGMSRPHRERVVECVIGVVVVMRRLVVCVVLHQVGYHDAEMHRHADYQHDVRDVE